MNREELDAQIVRILTDPRWASADGARPMARLLKAALAVVEADGNLAQRYAHIAFERALEAEGKP
jgi:hypothetical protein